MDLLAIYVFVRDRLLGLNKHPAREELPIFTVEWKTRHGEFQSQCRLAKKAFRTKPEALEFKKSLERACEILHYEEDIYIKIEQP